MQELWVFYFSDLSLSHSPSFGYLHDVFLPYEANLMQPLFHNRSYFLMEEENYTRIFTMNVLSLSLYIFNSPAILIQLNLP